MKTSELEGALLDYWVAMADGEKPYYESKDEAVLLEGLNWLKHGEFGSAKEVPKYSRDWAQGGPIIERERIEWDWIWREPNDPAPVCVIQYVNGDRLAGTGIEGQTPLIAAMRAYVASKFGDTVPDEVPHD